MVVPESWCRPMRAADILGSCANVMFICLPLPPVGVEPVDNAEVFKLGMLWPVAGGLPAQGARSPLLASPLPCPRRGFDDEATVRKKSLGILSTGGL